MINRWASILQKKISYILQHQITNSNLDPITITEVVLSNDKKFATIYFHCLKNIQKNQNQLNDLAKTIRHLLSKQTDFHHVPNLKFIYDNGLDKGKNIEEIISNLSK